MSSLRRFVLLVLFASIASVGLAQVSVHATRRADGSVTQVLYVLSHGRIMTYNVDATTGQASLVGQPLTLRPNLIYTFSLVPSPDDQHLYILFSDSENTQHLWVFATDAQGVPQSSPVQKLAVASVIQFEVHPSGAFAYALRTWGDPNEFLTSEVRLFTIDASTGMLTESPVSQGTYGPVYECGLGFNGFSPDGTAFYDYLFCGYHDSSEARYLSRSVDLQTGTLGADQNYFNWSNGSSGIDFVRSLNASDFVELTVPNDFQSGVSEINVYSIAPGSKQPLVHCTGQVLQACGNATGMQVNPTQPYLFLSLVPFDTKIVQVDLAGNQIVDTGNVIPAGQNLSFSPDGLVLYGYTYQFEGNATIQVYLFDPNSGAVTPGSLITVPGTLDGIFTAER